MLKRSIQVKVGDLIYDSMVEAAKFLNITPNYLSKLFANGIKTYNGFTLEKLGNDNRKKSGYYNKFSCKMKCLSTGEIFDSMSDLARKLKVNSWTLSTHLQKYNQYVDTNGTVYVRADNNYVPMKRELVNNKNHVFKGKAKCIKTTSFNYTELNEIEYLEKSAQILAKHKKYDIVSKLYDLISKLDQ